MEDILQCTFLLVLRTMASSGETFFMHTTLPTTSPRTHPTPFIGRSSDWFGATSFGELEFPWEIGEDPLNYHKKYCSRSCDGPVEDAQEWKPHCYPCSCSEHCKEYGTCCPDQHPTWARAIFDSVIQRYTSANSTLKVNFDSVIESPYGGIKYRRSQFTCDYHLFFAPIIVISRCPKTKTNRTLVDLCENDLTDAVDKYTPVSSLNTGVTFRNIYCLKCSADEDVEYTVRQSQTTSSSDSLEISNTLSDGKEDFKQWKLKITCDHYQTVYFVTSEDSFLREASGQSGLCDVSVTKPSDIPAPEQCDPAQFWPREERDLTSCSHADPILLWLCLLVDQLAFSTSSGGNNLFCMLCEGTNPSKLIGQTTTFAPTVFPTYPTKGTTDPMEPQIIPPLSLLLGISHRGKPELPECSNITFWDDDRECQPALCTAGKLPDESGECLSAIEQIRGLGYKVFLIFHPLKQLQVTRNDAQSLADYVSNRIAEMAMESEVYTNITAFFNTTSTSGDLEKITVLSYFVGNDSIGRDEYESSILGVFSNIWSLEKIGESEIHLKIKPVLLGEELGYYDEGETNEELSVLELESYRYGVRRTVASMDQDSYEDSYDGYGDYSSYTTPPFPLSSFLTTAPPLTSPSTPSSPVMSTAASESGGSKVVFTHEYFSKVDRIALWSLKHKFIDVTHSLSCPYVPVNITNGTSANKFPKFSFLFMGEAVSIPSMKLVSMVNGELQLCTSLYRKLTSPILTRTKQSTLEVVQYYLETICVALSVACLFLSSITYCLFPSLRSLPGLNNLSLCLSLAVAQICLLVTARWGVDERLPKSYCLAHAIFLHYSWLAAFAWMSVCCIHMFRVFTSHDNKFADNRSEKKRFAHYCVYGFGLPALIVTATIAANASMTSGDSCGYNSDICFLDTRRSAWTLALSLLVPLCLVILTNSVMFVLTIKEIIQVSNLQEHRRSRDRQGVLTYVKLSTLTGVLGAVVVVAVQLDIAVLSLLTSPLMALQGVFIFFSFTCNARVRKLYLDLFERIGISCGPESEKTSSTASTAVRTSGTSSKAQTASTRI